MEKPGLSMQLDENKDGYDIFVQAYVHCLTQLQPIIFYRCQYFVFEHSQEYQRIQFRFWDAVETFDPEAIVVSAS